MKATLKVYGQELEIEINDSKIEKLKAKKLAENNARADKLYSDLRQFAVENRKYPLGWDTIMPKYCIRNHYAPHPDLYISYSTHLREFGQIYFDCKETCEKALEKYKDELIWYFNEYQDSL